MRHDGVWRPILGGCRKDSRKGVLWPSRKQGHRHFHSDLKKKKLLFNRILCLLAFKKQWRTFTVWRSREFRALCIWRIFYFLLQGWFPELQCFEISSHVCFFWIDIFKINYNLLEWEYLPKMLWCYSNKLEEYLKFTRLLQNKFAIRSFNMSVPG